MTREEIKDEYSNNPTVIWMTGMEIVIILLLIISVFIN